MIGTVWIRRAAIHASVTGHGARTGRVRVRGGRQTRVSREGKVPREGEGRCHGEDVQPQGREKQRSARCSTAAKGDQVPERSAA